MKEKKREELIPFLLINIAFTPEPQNRQKLLQVLFNLISTPNEAQRYLLTLSCKWLTNVFTPQGLLFVHSSAHSRTIFFQNPSRGWPFSSELSQELLPQCWEQVTSTYPERRILVSECTGALSSSVDPDLRMSLLLSILSQLSTDSDPHVRTAVTVNLAQVLVSYPVCDSLQVSYKRPT